MNDSELIERLGALPNLTSLPREQLEWLASHGELIEFDTGSVPFSNAERLPGMFIVLSGRLSSRTDRDGVTRIVREIEAGAISGHLPYSRLKRPAAYLVAQEPVSVLLIPAEKIREMTRACYDFTALCVHEMVDRTRLFKSESLRQEKMAALGRLAAGLAHELNNPVSAIGRSAEEMNKCLRESTAAAKELGTAGLTSEGLELLATLESAVGEANPGGYSMSAIADREEALEDGLSGLGLDADLAHSLASTSLTVDDLAVAAELMTPAQLRVVTRYLAARAEAGGLTGDIESAAKRIHLLLDAIKTHTHMDRAPVPEPIHLEGHLADTLTLIGSKARSKGVTLELTVESELPIVHGLVGDLNHVWLHLVDNAIDAAPEGGHVSVTAGHEHGQVVVRVIDDGSGISEEDQRRIFEPFFTTKEVGAGTGLGLDIVQQLLRSQKGSVDVDSVPGRTEFRVCLPVAGGVTAVV